jgi:hypothetical protein
MLRSIAECLLKSEQGGISMNIRKKWLPFILGICFVWSAQIAVAETDIDLRVKIGSAAGADKVEITNIAQADTTSESSGNFQIEVAFSPRQGPVNFVGTVGIFGRNHAGHVDDLFLPTDVEYDAGGLSGSAGISIAADNNLHFEGRLELALGSGKPTLTSPNAVWNTTKEGGYSSTSLILGGYYTISRPGLQIGLELGAQSFTGNFQIWNNGGFWTDGKVKGSGGTANLVIGYRF